MFNLDSASNRYIVKVRITPIQVVLSDNVINGSLEFGHSIGKTKR